MGRIIAQVLCEWIINASSSLIVVMEYPRTATVHVRHSSCLKMRNREVRVRMRQRTCVQIVEWEAGERG
eukprot:2014023-Rhodomonas_salina.1